MTRWSSQTSLSTSRELTGKNILMKPCNLHSVQIKLALSAKLTPSVSSYLSQKTPSSINFFNQKSMQTKLRCLLGITLSVILFSFVTTSVFGQATVTTDKPDYAPRSNAVFTGSGFAPGEDVVLKVKNLFQPCHTVNPDSSYLAWAVTADASGAFVTNWTVCDCPGDSLRLKATGQTSGLMAYALFSDAGNFTYATTTGKNSSVTLLAGATNNSILSSDITAPKNNGTFTVSLSFATQSGTTIGIGSLSNQINLTSLTNVSYATGGSGGNSVTNIFPITVTVGSGVADGTYNFETTAVPTPSGNPNPGGKWQFTVIVGSGSTGGSIASVSIDAQSGTSVYGTASTLTFPVTSLRGSNGSVNGTYSVSGLPSGVTSGFTPAGSNTFSSSGSNPFPGTTLNLDVPATLGAGSYSFSVSLTDGTSIASTTGTLIVNKAPLTVTANNQSKTYDGNTFTGGGGTFTSGITGFVNGQNLASSGVSGLASYTGAATTAINFGTYTITPAIGTLTATNYDFSILSNGSLQIGKADANITVTPYSLTYDGNPHTATGTATGVETSPANLNALLTLTATTHTNAGDYPADAWSFAGNTNYKAANGTVHDVIDKKPASVTPNANSKYCGQVDPSPLTGVLSGFLAADGVTATYIRAAGQTTGVYTISATLSPAGVLDNYDITYNTANFTINGITAIDASASSTPVPLGSSAVLSATISPAVMGVTVTFTLDPGTSYTAVTNSLGVATTNPIPGLSVNLYKAVATAGSACAVSAPAYLPVYDPNGSFITGGGWIMSPAGAYYADPSLTGKANFGFNAQYKKGSNIPNGNTEFQFQAGNLNFKSTNYSTGSLVVAGARAIFKGTGTINGMGAYNFMVSAIDGEISGGGGIDKFRIKIWNTTDIIYDNNIGMDENSAPTTILGGGSIVIHDNNAKKSTARLATSTEVDTPAPTLFFNIKASPNPTTFCFNVKLESDNISQPISLNVVDISGKLIEMRKNLVAGQTFQLGVNYKPGMYFVELLQGDRRRIVKLVKQPD
jgi:hypothetical protein